MNQESNFVRVHVIWVFALLLLSIVSTYAVTRSLLLSSLDISKEEQTRHDEVFDARVGFTSSIPDPKTKPSAANFPKSVSVAASTDSAVDNLPDVISDPTTESHSSTEALEASTALHISTSEKRRIMNEINSYGDTRSNPNSTIKEDLETFDSSLQSPF